MKVFIWAIIAILATACGALFALLDIYLLGVICLTITLISIIFLYDTFDKSGWQ